MTLIKRCVAVAGTAVLFSLSLTACGDDNESDASTSANDAPNDASTEEFCEAYNADDDLAEDASAEDKADAAHEQADKIIEVGTPDGMSDDEREGFEIFVDAINDIDADDVEGFENAESEDDFKDAIGASDDEFEKVTAFLSYAQTTCAATE